MEKLENREAWLTAMTEELRPHFTEADVGERVSSSVPSSFCAA